MATRGPNTGRGKAAVRRNALKHGLGAGEPVVRQVESVEDWYRHVEQVIADRQPEGYVETMLAERAANLFWRLRRVPYYEADKISVALDQMPEEYAETLKYGEKVSGTTFEEGMTLEKVQMQTGIRMVPDPDTLNVITRYEAHLHRQLLQTLHELEAMQDRRRGERSPPRPPRHHRPSRLMKVSPVTYHLRHAYRISRKITRHGTDRQGSPDEQQGRHARDDHRHR